MGTIEDIKQPHEDMPKQSSCVVGTCVDDIAISCDRSLSLRCSDFSGQCHDFMTQNGQPYAWCDCGLLTVHTGLCLSEDLYVACDVSGQLLMDSCLQSEYCESSVVGDTQSLCVCRHDRDNYCDRTRCPDDPDCETCVPHCEGKVCGDDGCAGSCGECADGECNGTVCVSTCGNAFCLPEEFCITTTKQCIDSASMHIRLAIPMMDSPEEEEHPRWQMPFVAFAPLTQEDNYVECNYDVDADRLFIQWNFHDQTTNQELMGWFELPTGETIGYGSNDIEMYVQLSGFSDFEPGIYEDPITGIPLPMRECIGNASIQITQDNSQLKSAEFSIDCDVFQAPERWLHLLSIGTCSFVFDA